MVIADTSAWISFQRRPDSNVGREMESLLRGDQIVMIGPVMTELLQGTGSEHQREFFANRVSNLEYIETDRETWLMAGNVSSRLRRRGVTLGFADLIIATLSIQHGIPLYAIDGDFDDIPELQRYESDSDNG